MRTLAVWVNDQTVGWLHEGASLWRFDYDPQWVGAPGGFDLSPALPRAQLSHVDGGSTRPVQWYFDNLLPEEGLRQALSNEAGLASDDAFALLQYLGAESAGSLTLLPAGRTLEPKCGAIVLTNEVLSQRIRNLPRETLSHAAPKRMSLAGAQHKLLVVFRDQNLFEPLGSEPSTHILKPNHPDTDYASSVINEYFTMRLAKAVGLDVPTVWRHYVPEPIYIIERFDRLVDFKGGATQRRHIIDACQLMNKDRQFKYHAATLQTLHEIVLKCRNRMLTRQRLYRWLVFNTLIGNHDNHLKNLSFTVSADGIELAPHYDLLSTAVYDTQAFANERAIWPAVPLTTALPGVTTFAQVTRSAMLQAGDALGLAQKTAQRELDRMMTGLPEAVNGLISDIETQNRQAPEPARVFLAGELRLLRTIEHIIVPDIVTRCLP
jgi:serine/threonine-protein kinase HipA